MRTHVNLDGSLFEADVDEDESGAIVVSVADLPPGQVPLGVPPGTRREFPVIVGGRAGTGVVESISFHCDRSTMTTITARLDSGPGRDPGPELDIRLIGGCT